MKFIPSLLFFVLSIFVISSCYYDDEQTLYQYVGTDCNTDNVSFSTDIMPIISASCATAGCHDSKTAASNTILETYDEIKGSVDSKRFLGSIVHDNKYKPMPLGGQFLPQCDIDKIKAWIDAGALDN